MKKRILIIDDQYLDDRDKIYEETLSAEYDVLGINTGNEVFTTINEVEVDLYLVDIVLENWTNNGDPLLVKDVLKAITTKNSSSPILLISSQYEVLVKNSRLTRLMNEILSEKFNVINFIVWNEFLFSTNNSSEANNAKSRITLELAKHNQIQNNIKISKFDIGIITALQEEMDPFIDKFDKSTISEIQINNQTFRALELQCEGGNTIKIIVSVQNNMGTVDTSFLTSMMIENFDIDHLFMIGVCGGREGEVNIGDVIIPDTSIAYQYGKLKEKEGLVLDAVQAPSNSPLKSALVVKEINSLLKNLFIKFNTNLMQNSKPGFALENEPVLRFDPMACGDVVIDLPKELDKLSNSLGKRKLCSVDMESYAILRTGIHYPNIKTTVMKSVMDLTTKKNDQFKYLSAYLSAELLHHVLNKGIYKV